MAAIINIDDGTTAVNGSVERDSAYLAAAFTLSNFDDTSVAGWRWTLVDKPIGSSAALTTPDAAATTVTPDVAGTYLVRLETFADAARSIADDVDEQLVSVAFPAPHDWSVPAAGETTQRGSRGWATPMEEVLRDLQAAISVPSATALVVVAPEAPGETALVIANVISGSKTLLAIDPPAGEPADASAPYYLFLDNGVSSEYVIVVERDGALRRIAGPAQNNYPAGPSTVAFAGLATSPERSGLLSAADKHILDGTTAASDAHRAHGGNPHSTTQQQTYAAGRFISASAGPIEITTPAIDGTDPGIVLLTSMALRGAALTPAGLSSSLTLAIGPAPATAGDDGWAVSLRGGDGGAGASIGGNVDIEAGEVTGGGGEEGDIFVGANHARRLLLGNGATSVEVNGTLVVNGAGVITEAEAGGAVPSVDAGAGAQGVSNNYARADHVHPAKAAVTVFDGATKDTSAADSGKIILCSNGGLGLVTIVLQELTPEDIGTTIEYVQNGPDMVMLDPDTWGVGLRWDDTRWSYPPATAGVGSSIVITYITETTVLVRGDLLV